MILSMTTDYAKDKGDPAPALRAIADAGFTHVHWCHQWNTDFLYVDPEIAWIESKLREYGLRLLNLHGSVGPEKNWASPLEYERLAGVDLVRNRIDMTARLGADVVILHVPNEPCDPVRRSLDELEPFARKRRVRLAIENGGGGSNFPALTAYLSEYSPEFLGLCYDSGHGNFPAPGTLDRLEPLRKRLYAIHLHDNDGASDQHRLPFTGTVDWNRLAGILADSPCAGNVNLESNMRQTPGPDERDYLAQAFQAAQRVATLVQESKRTV